MLKFFEIAQEYPPLREAADRKQDFKEIYAGYAAAKAAEQAGRCSQCGVPFCQVHCPLQNNIPDWLRLVAEGRLEEAYAVSSATNTFPEICGRLCPQDRLCEGNCVVNNGFNSITIGAIEKFVTENAFAEGWIKPFAPARENGHSIGIIGAGPAGLAAAESLRRRGYAVHVYDRYDRMGGLLVYGIPNFKIDKQIIARRIEQYEQSGIVFHHNADVGGNITLQSLRDKHSAVLIATGVYKARALSQPRPELSGIMPAMDYLIASNRECFGITMPDNFNANGKKVVVIGGGDTAMDCVRTAIRQNAASVTCLYRRDRKNMPGSQREVRYAEEEGVKFEWLSTPRLFSGNLHLQSITAQRMHLGMPDASGRRGPEVISGSDFVLDADIAITALGFDPEDLPTLFGEPDLQVRVTGTLKVSSDYQTNLPGVFAAGDIVRGASLVVWAIRDGREAAIAIDNSIMTQTQRKAA